MTQKCEKLVSDGTMTGRIDTKAVSRMTTKIHRIRWTIENVSRVALETQVISPDFHLATTLPVSIGFKRTDRHLYVFVNSKADTEIQIERKILLFNCNDQKLHEENDTKTFTLEKDQNIDLIGTVHDISRLNALPSDTLIIDLSISIRGEIKTEMCHFQYVTDTKKKLLEDLKNMQENSVNSDVSLQIDNDRIPAHWSILCSRSQYFKRMFDSEMSERVQNSIIFTGISLCTLKKLIKFMYTADFVENDDEDLEELFDLYYAADKYEVMDLRTLCSSKIMSKATADTVCQIFQFAHRHNDKILKLHALDYIQLHSDAVLRTDGWKQLESSEPLAVELITFCFKYKISSAAVTVI